MRSFRRLEFTEEAEADLQSLLEYTLVTWGAEQQDRYADRLTRTMHELLSRPELGPARNDLAPGLRNRRAGQHVIYYEVFEQSIRVVRILHAKMNPETHLEGPS